MEQGCNSYVSNAVLLDLFMSQPELIEKLKLFREKKNDLIDPLLRFCPRTNCNGRVNAASMNSLKLTCPDCRTNICFSCREEWHGYFSTCEGAFFS